MTRGMWAVGAAAVLGLVLSATPASAVPIFWTDWQGTDTDAGVGFTGNGVITTSTSTVNVTYDNDLGIAFYYTGLAGETDFWVRQGGGRVPATSPYTSAEVDNIPDGGGGDETDMIALRWAGPQTLTFDQTIANPVFAFVSLNGNGYSFLNQDFEILSIGGTNGDDCGYWGCGGVTKVVQDLGGGNVAYFLNASNVGGSEPHGVIRFLGAFDSLTWTSTSNENWNGFTVGVQGTAAEVTTGTTTTAGTSGTAPEPAALALLGMGLLAAGARLRRRA